MEAMYRGVPFSPQTALSAAVGAADAVIPVEDVSAFPPAPSYATIGTDEGAETVLYTALTENALSGCTRGVEGTAKAWAAGEAVARNFTAADHGALVGNIEELVAGMSQKADLIDGKVSPAQLPASEVPVVTTKGDGAAYTATVPGITQLALGMLLIVIPHTTSTTKAVTLNVNDMGPVTISRRTSAGTSAGNSGLVNIWLTEGLPLLLMYDGTYWIAIGLARPSATDLTSVVPISKGGTGKTAWEANKLVYLPDGKTFNQISFPAENGGFLRQNATGAPYWSTPKDVLSDIGAAAASHTHTAEDISALPGTDYTASRVRGISAGTTDLTAGTSDLESGTIYLVYE